LRSLIAAMRVRARELPPLPRAVLRRLYLVSRSVWRAVRGLAARSRRALFGVPSRARAGIGRLAWRIHVDRYLMLPITLQLVAGRAHDDAIPVIMCLWARPARIADTLEQLAGQSECPPIRLILWNNRPANDAHYLAAIRAMGATGAIASVEFYSSRANVGGIARFLVARSITARSDATPFVMLDDDQDVSDHLIADLLAAWGPRTYAGFWSFTMVSSYWDRHSAELGAQASYVGTGGSICDSSLVHTRGFFSHLPARFGFIEDLWASRFAASHGWSLRRVDTPIELLDEAGNQYHALRELKPVFWDYLEAKSAGGVAL
jgi:hypothetical protein